ncbi:MAG TPA: sugar transferase [Bacteroidota bacterium]|nr:sugar transferase [Bacteroidota bacterium]
MLKRSFDVVASIAGLFLLLPVLGAVAAAIRITAGRPVMYRASRVGRGGRPFRMVKFRTMVVGADAHGPLVTASGDDRVTPVGRMLRKTKLDELPTLWNVLLGDMSFVGPRPENPLSAAQYNDEQRRVLTVRPGVTSLATIKYRHEEALLAGGGDLDARYFAIMQDKLRLELEYVDHHPFSRDMSIIARTIRAIFTTEDALA